MPRHPSSRPSRPRSSARASRSPSSANLLEVAKNDAAAALAALREFDAHLAAQSEQLGRFRIQLEAAQAEWERLGAAVTLSTETVREAESEVERTRSRPR